MYGTHGIDQVRWSFSMGERSTVSLYHCRGMCSPLTPAKQSSTLTRAGTQACPYVAFHQGSAWTSPYGMVDPTVPLCHCPGMCPGWGVTRDAPTALAGAHGSVRPVCESPAGEPAVGVLSQSRLSITSSMKFSVSGISTR